MLMRTVLVIMMIIEIEKNSINNEDKDINNYKEQS